jgi:glycosyltransferase involved in cell wall biosynthesis
MKIVLVNTYDQKGGAARAVSRVFHGLKRAGCDVSFMVQNKESDEPGILVAGSGVARWFNFIRPYIDFAIPLLQVRKRILFSTSLLPDQFIGSIEKADPDIIHLNWIAGGMIRIESLAHLKIRVVWTFHDLWAFTGGCHYPPAGCTRYGESCGCCPLLHSNHEKDLSRSVFERKRRAYDKIKNLTIVTPSRWLADCVKSGSLLNDREVTVIPNGLDLSVFKPGDKEEARRKYNLPLAKKLILFGGIRGVEYRLKGFHLLVEAMKKASTADIELVVFGSEYSKLAECIPMKTHFLGHIAGEERLAALYSAADVVAVPSYQEVFGQTASEALACGVPVVAFAATGLLDIVDHQTNGYLAKPYDTVDLAKGIDWILENRDRYMKLSRAARRKAETHFDIDIVVGQYLELYRTCLSNSAPA